jgi:hypothetical protein
VYIQKDQREEENLVFDKGVTIFMGLGIATDTLPVENCSSGWTSGNSGIGYYNGKICYLKV